MIMELVKDSNILLIFDKLIKENIEDSELDHISKYDEGNLQYYYLIINTDNNIEDFKKNSYFMNNSYITNAFIFTGSKWKNRISIYLDFSSYLTIIRIYKLKILNNGN